MQLIGILNSPFVRRVAISLKYYGIPFEHYPLSTFDNFDTIFAINSVAKIPTLILDNGDILLDSSLILEYFEAQMPTAQKLQPSNPIELANSLRVIGLALVGCEKTVQLVYECKKRPKDKQYQALIDRVTKQINGAFTALEKELASQSFKVTNDSINQATITIAVAWTFNQKVMPHLLDKNSFPNLTAVTDELEKLPIFMDTQVKA